MKTEVTELLGIEYPIIQGGMAWVAEYHLAAAVSAAGGLGPVSYTHLDVYKRQGITDHHGKHDQQQRSQTAKGDKCPVFSGENRGVSFYVYKQ